MNINYNFTLANQNSSVAVTGCRVDLIKNYAVVDSQSKPATSPVTGSFVVTTGGSYQLSCYSVDANGNQLGNAVVINYVAPDPSQPFPSSGTASGS